MKEDTRGRRMVREVHQLLREQMRTAGHGTIGELEAAVGKRPGWLRNRRRLNSFETGELVDVLDCLGLDPARFFRRAWRRVDDGSHLVERPPGRPPPIVTRVRRRLEDETPRRQIGRAYLEELDRLRYEEPRRVVELAEDAVPHLAPELLPRLLGVAGSAYRILVELDLAEHAILAGLEIARERGEDGRVTGELLQRLAYVVGDRGEHGPALRIAERAMAAYMIAGDLAGVGKTLVVQSMLLYYLDRAREAAAASEVALRYLPDSEQRHRFSALAYLGFAYLALGDPPTAARYAGEARKFSSGMSPLFLGKLIWLQGLICVELEQLDRAEEHLREVVEVFQAINQPGETALVTTDLVRVLLKRGRRLEAHQTAQTMLPLLAPRRSNQILSGAIADLLRHGTAGLTLELVERVRAQIEKQGGALSAPK